MTETADDRVPQLLRAARAGSQEALGELLDACRAYLLLVAEREMDADLRVKSGASDLVQQTFIEAQRDLQGFRGESEAELLGWLRQVLLNNLSNLARQYRETAKRDVGREVQLDAGPSSLNWKNALRGKAATPSRLAMENETTQLLDEALARLPEDYRQVILYRYEGKKSFDEIGRLLNRSPDAARKLWSRAVERLQQELEGR